jgi:hypothetical protein
VPNGALVSLDPGEAERTELGGGAMTTPS